MKQTEQYIYIYIVNNKKHDRASIKVCNNVTENIRTLFFSSKSCRINLKASWSVERTWMCTHALCTAATPELDSIHDSTALRRRSPCREESSTHKIQTWTKKNPPRQQKGRQTFSCCLSQLRLEFVLEPHSSPQLSLCSGSFTFGDMLFQLDRTLDD